MADPDAEANANADSAEAAKEDRQRRLAEALTLIDPVEERALAEEWLTGETFGSDPEDASAV